MSKIIVKKCPTADTRTCDPTKVTKDQLLRASMLHIGDVRAGLQFFITKMMHALMIHDEDKIFCIDWFHEDFVTGFKQTSWWENHRKITRHHLGHEDGIPGDVNLVDVLEMVVDCVVAGMARSGQVRPLELKDGLLQQALENTVKLLASQIEVVE